MIKDLIKKNIPDEWRYRIVEFKYNNFPEKIIQKWEQDGKPIPPHPVVKQKTIKEYQRRYQYNILVETGTYLGYMVSAQKRNFDKIYSVEISESLYKRAYKKFKRYSHIKLILGDSGEKMADIISEINEPAIFWLDGHYSAGITSKGELNCPIWKELDAIFTKNLPHIFLIDDARDFKGENDYPTIKELTEYFKKKNPQYNITVINDIIRAEL
ncbi:hypothetical protein ACE01N_09605 [Saccharicrinis sp. FJH2]|uniref:hypothetical protein n=1 Tax=Saccharicrinis sp. FJH65 TaxID=3344659 RepID=UPI0035F35CDD